MAHECCRRGACVIPLGLEHEGDHSHLLQLLTNDDAYAWYQAQHMGDGGTSWVHSLAHAFVRFLETYASRGFLIEVRHHLNESAAREPRLYTDGSGRGP